MQICKPVVNKSHDQMNSLQRAAESFRYVLLCLESWISPEGKVRAWTRTNARIAVFIAAPTFLVLPVVTMALWELGAWLNALTAIASKLIFLPILALLALVSISFFCRILRVFKR